MAHESTVDEQMQIVHIAHPQPIGQIMSVKVGWTPGVSATNQAYKALSNLVRLGKLERGNGYFRIPGCKSDYGEHARILTSLLAKILMLPFEATVFREHTIADIGLRPDALVLLRHDDRGLCFVLEAVNEESEESLLAKYHAWQHWPDANRYLSQLFGVPIAHCDFVRSEELDRYIEEIIYGELSARLRGRDFFSARGMALRSWRDVARRRG